MNLENLDQKVAKIVNMFLNTPVNKNVIESFIKICYKEFDLALHFDDTFHDYVNNETHKPLFSKEAADALDKVVDHFTEWCNSKGLDIHEIHGPVQQAEFKQRGIIPQDTGDNEENQEEPEELTEFADNFVKPGINREYQDISKENFYTEVKQFMGNKKMITEISGDIELSVDTNNLYENKTLKESINKFHNKENKNLKERDEYGRAQNKVEGSEDYTIRLKQIIAYCKDIVKKSLAFTKTSESNGHHYMNDLAQVAEDLKEINRFLN